MEVIVRPDVDSAVDLVARLVSARVRRQPNAVLGLATGRTMELVYANLVRSSTVFSYCHTFNLDEYIGLAPDDLNS